MPPKLSKEAKLDLILTHLRATGTCHTLKDLEKTLPPVASINGIQVKEYIQALLDEGKLRVEKIGSGNWYWIFGSDEKLERERVVGRVKTEVEKTRKSCADAQAARVAETALRQREEPDDVEDRESRRDTLMATRISLEAEVGRLRATEMQRTSSRGSTMGVTQIRQALGGLQQQAQQWTDNIYILEGYLRQLAGGDREVVTAVLRECYGDEYVDGGLRELDE
ncbi:Meiotic nuclear division protein 1 [Penicillium riverlandense]|uniref:Meiotic nuclear division protein 1 n=1 Tax=Penicillium riverlandense TaxID=1903569 RepID=UPI0025471CB4|nr:Meiotic nuclear division protein 1 [Penicillium riverlandense]KAJ5811927.1 Meiotic nuclear division protein 1 [Penicillium riverlandense]